MERKADDMKQFALDSMPSFVERISGPDDFDKFQAKANKYGLPMMLVFSENRLVMNEMKYLSTEFRRRVLVAHISLSKKENRNIFFEYGVRGQALITIPPTDGGEVKQSLVTFDGKWNLHRLRSFFAEHALKTEVKPKPKPDEEAKTKEEDLPSKQKQKVKTELQTDADENCVDGSVCTRDLNDGQMLLVYTQQKTLGLTAFRYETKTLRAKELHV